MLRVCLLLAGLIILVVGCVGRNPDYDPDYEVNEHFVGRFCLDPGNLHQNYIYIRPNKKRVHGRGKGVLPGLPPTEDWNYYGLNPFDEDPPRLEITIEGEGVEGSKFVVWLLEDNNSIELRDTDTMWSSDRLTRCH